ncbi:TraG family conjugative transposon ATPase [Porphyromonas levii]|uniref:TraG family conjugative transposon ATPase n=1 Tax=Porphyromonas levii TaxID=28114 RepID=UPI001BA70781|nr:TraG family conjugative transposon ATPase [Porphyromonas levii]MBR8801719.1 hypothetical protein [Porphyromonas levii]
MFKTKKKVSPLQEVLPIVAVENDFLISKQATFTACYEVTLPEIFSLSEIDYEKIQSIWYRAINILPDLTVVHKQDHFISKRYEVDFGAKEFSFFDKAYERHFLERPYQDHKCYLYITKCNPKNFRTETLFSTLTHRRLLPYGALDMEALEIFSDKLLQFEEIFGEGSFMKIRRLTREELVGTSVGGDGHSIKKGIVEEYLTLFQDIPLTDISLHEDHVKVGNYYVDAHCVSNIDYLPNMVTSSVNNDMYSVGSNKQQLSFLSPIGLLLPCDHIVNQYIYLEDTKEVVKRLEQKKNILISVSSIATNNQGSRDSLVEFLNVQGKDAARLVRSHINVLSFSESPEERKKLNAKVAAALAKCDIMPYRDTITVPQIFWAGIPGCGNDISPDDTFICFLSTVTCLMTLETNYRDSPSPFGIKLCERLSGRPVHVDISDEPMKKGIINNRNKFIVGPSGSGKSFFMNHMLRQYYEQCTHVVIVDVGHSYEHLCQIINIKTKGEDGIYYTYDENNPLSFNPFYTDDYIYSEDKKNSLATLLFTLWKGAEEPITNTERSVMGSAIESYIDFIREHREVRPCFDSFYGYMHEVYRKIMENSQVIVDEYDFDLDNFLVTLDPYITGHRLGYLLNSDANIDLLKKKFVVFEIDKIKDNLELLPIITIIITDMFINKMRMLPKDVRKVIVIEEAWSALANANMADFIAYLYRTVRKFYGEAMVVTQNISDLVGNQVVKDTIVNNSDCKIVLDMGKFSEHFDAIAEMLGLNMKQRAQVLSINAAKGDTKGRNPFKEAWIGLGESFGVVYATEVSREEYFAYTTESSEKEKVKRELAKCDNNIDRALTHLASADADKNS